MNTRTTSKILCGILIGILIGILLYKARGRSSLRLYSAGLGRRLVLPLLALVLTWYLLFWFMTLTTGRILAPWDQWAGFAPPAGTWQRQLNDFFSRDAHQRLLALAIVGSSGLLFLVGILRAPGKEALVKLPLAFAATNLGFIGVSFLAILVTQPLPDLWLSQPRPSVDVGYHRTWPDLLITGALLGLLFWLQGRVIKPAPRSREGEGGPTGLPTWSHRDGVQRVGDNQHL